MVVGNDRLRHEVHINYRMKVQPLHGSSTLLMKHCFILRVTEYAMLIYTLCDMPGQSADAIIESKAAQVIDTGSSDSHLSSLAVIVSVD
jgi:hypothetical protein